MVLAGRILLAVVFALAAAGKLANRPRTAQTLEEFGVPEGARPFVVWALPIAELAIAICLIPASTAAWAALAAALLLAAFTVAVARVLARGEEVDCNCFGSLGPSRITPWTAVRNVALLLVAIAVAIAAQSDPGPGAVAWISDLDTAGAAVLVAGIAVALAALNFAFSWQLMRQNGRLLNEIEGLRIGAVHEGRAAPQAGDFAPDFELPALDGGSLSLERILSVGRGAAILVTDPGCGACQPLLPEVGRLQNDPGLAVPFVVISRGSFEDNYAKAEEHGLGPVLLEEEFEVSRALGSHGAPGLIQLDPDGRHIAKPAMGNERVGEALALLASPDSADSLLTVHQGGAT